MTYVDQRATRFGGALTATTTLAALLAAWLVPTAAGPAITAIALIATVLLVAAVGGPRWNLGGHTYRLTLAPHLDPPTDADREPAAPPRFANLLGAVFLAAAISTWVAGSPPVATALVLVVTGLAAWNAATGFCLGCRFYGLLVLRGRPKEAIATGNRRGPT